ncbi:cysteine ABC transporter substrate-binding protein [Corynebacterium sanguinis]|uniref:cysteine ABC transporter substrate-binding protein n=1 Tax=Corynebacterium sanguinis TaxID=2594913 RepID=UPI00223BCEE4|nr:cysteine ABC transporter substrate-binding protein [Corynebacterium sanguinis]MCT2287744.1 cysteine ABC transporter substrate-binding protein [Corynebacterium sanguinis]
MALTLRASALRTSVVLAALLTLLTVFLAACSSSSGSEESSVRTLDQIKEDGTIRLGVFSDKAPFGYVDANGEYAGYDIEYGKRIAQDLGVEVEWVPVEAASRVEFVDTGKVDAILANFTVTDERKEKVDFANPYMKVSLGAVTPDAAPITDVAGLEGKNVIVVKGTTAEAYLEQHHAEITLQKYEQYTEATNALLDGRGDAWVTDNTEVLAWAANTPGYSATITSLGDIDTIAAAVKKGNTTLLDWLNEELVSLGEENFFHDDYEKTLKPVYGDQVSADELVVEGGQL